MNVQSYSYATAAYMYQATCLYDNADSFYLSVSGLLSVLCVVILLMTYATSTETVIVHSTTDTDTAMIVIWTVEDGELFSVVWYVIGSGKIIQKIHLKTWYGDKGTEWPWADFGGVRKSIWPQMILFHVSASL